MFPSKSRLRAMMAVAALGAGTVLAQSRNEAPPIIIQAANAEVREGEIVEIYLDSEITTSDVYRVLMRAPDVDRRLTIREDGVVLKNERVYEPVAPLPPNVA